MSVEHNIIRERATVFGSAARVQHLEQVGMRLRAIFSAILTDYQDIKSTLHNMTPCQLPCFFMRLDMGVFAQRIDRLLFSQILGCQLVQKETSSRTIKFTQSPRSGTMLDVSYNYDELCKRFCIFVRLDRQNYHITYEFYKDSGKCSPKYALAGSPCRM